MQRAESSGLVWAGGLRWPGGQVDHLSTVPSPGWHFDTTWEPLSSFAAMERKARVQCFEPASCYHSCSCAFPAAALGAGPGSHHGLVAGVL